MRAVFLNCWQGTAFDALVKFIKEQSLDTDIFCFQETPPVLFSKMSKILPDYYGQYDSGGVYYPHNVWYSHAIFVRKDIQTSASKKLPIFQEAGEKIGFMQYASLKKSGKSFYVGNIHGTPYPGNKLDTLTRITQSKKIIDLFASKKGLKIFGGDFNLSLDTKSIKLFEIAGYRNLIKEFNIKATRNELSWKVHAKEDNFVKQYYADYVFISPDIKVKSFEVPNIEISDHLPMILDFDI